MNDEQRFQLSLHYGRIQWLMTGFIVASMGVLLGYTLHNHYETWAAYTGLIVSVLGTYAVARLRVMRAGIHDRIRDAEMRDEMHRRAGWEHLPRLWEVFVLGVILMDICFTVRVFDRSHQIDVGWKIALTFACGILILGSFAWSGGFKPLWIPPSEVPRNQRPHPLDPLPESDGS